MNKKVRVKKTDTKYPMGKPSVDISVDFVENRLARLEGQYNKLSKEYAHLVSIGIGLKAIGILDTLRQLAFLYTDIAAHQDALRSLKVDINS